MIDVGRSITSCHSLLKANRTEPNLSDLALAFRDLGVNLSEVSEFCREVESNPCAHVVPKYPLTKKSYHVYNGPSSHTMVRGSRNSSFSSDEEDEGYIPSYLPPLPQKGDGSNGMCVVGGRGRSCV